MSVYRMATESGIAPLHDVRRAMIELRNSALDQLPDGADGAVLLSHAIWWLSTIDDDDVTMGRQQGLFDFLLTEVEAGRASMQGVADMTGVDVSSLEKRAGKRLEAR